MGAGVPGVADPIGKTMSEGGSAEHPWSVSDLNACVSQLLAGSLPGAFFVEGEISNFRTYDRGHAFFTLKDSASELPCIMWKDALARLKFKPKDGLAVILRGPIRLYEPQGKLQLYVETMLPRGTGALELAFRQLCDKLRAEGLFEQSRKRPLPTLPRHVVIITSRTGDVLHDVLTTAYRRYPGLHTMLYPVRVQGAQAAPDIVRAIERINAEVAAGRLMVDVILLVRGGGSLEDLWAFNEEALARAIVASEIPIATGIGHEPDTTIADLVGDLRGPTPTGVTELTIPDVRALSADITSKRNLLTRDLRRRVDSSSSALDRAALRLASVASDTLRRRRQRIDTLGRHIDRIEPRHAIAQGWRRVEDAQRRLEAAMRACVRTRIESLVRAANRLDRASPLIRVHRQRDRLDNLRGRLRTALASRTAGAAHRLSALAEHLRIVSPQAVLERGFSITTMRDGTIIRSTRQVRRGEVITTRVADGSFDSTVGKPKQATLF
jgi:exodeoxyribonuclease VII large subunit